jgi:hypothetical protein
VRALNVVLAFEGKRGMEQFWELGEFTRLRSPRLPSQVASKGQCHHRSMETVTVARYGMGGSEQEELKENVGECERGALGFFFGVGGSRRERMLIKSPVGWGGPCWGHLGQG